MRKGVFAYVRFELFILIHTTYQQHFPELSRSHFSNAINYTFYPILLFRLLFCHQSNQISLSRKINILLAWSLSDLWNGFFPSPGKELSSLTEGEELEVEFWGLLDCPSDCLPSQAAQEIETFKHRDVQRNITRDICLDWNKDSLMCTP